MCSILYKDRPASMGSGTLNNVEEDTYGQRKKLKEAVEGLWRVSEIKSRKSRLAGLSFVAIDLHGCATVKPSTSGPQCCWLG